MNTTKTLADLKPGDFVCIDEAQDDLRIRKVEKVTRTQITAGGGTYYRVKVGRRSAGQRVSGRSTTWGPTYNIRPATPDDIAAWEAAKARRKSAAATDEAQAIAREQRRQKWLAGMARHIADGPGSEAAQRLADIIDAAQSHPAPWDREESR